MDPLAPSVTQRYWTALRVARRFASEESPVDLNKLEITSENLEEVLNGLIAGVDDIEGVEKRLGLDLRNMTQLMRQSPHNDDLYHNGEDVLTHIGWVMDDAAKLSANMSAEKRVLLKLTALCHDLGKPYTYKYDEVKAKHTFYDHAATSVEIAKVLLAKHKDQLGKLYQQVLDFTRLHDTFYALAYERTTAPGGSTKYVQRLMQEAIYQQGLLRDLFDFTKADSYRARSHAEKLKETEAVLEDVIREEQAAEEARAAQARLQQVIQDRMPQIKAYLEPEAPEAAAVLPDLKAAKRILGTARRFDLLKGIEAILKTPL